MLILSLDLILTLLFLHILPVVFKTCIRWAKSSSHTSKEISPASSLIYCPPWLISISGAWGLLFRCLLLKIFLLLVTLLLFWFISRGDCNKKNCIANANSFKLPMLLKQEYWLLLINRKEFSATSGTWDKDTKQVWLSCWQLRYITSPGKQGQMMKLKWWLFPFTGEILYATKASRQGADVPNKCYLQSGNY